MSEKLVPPHQSEITDDYELQRWLDEGGNIGQPEELTIALLGLSQDEEDQEVAIAQQNEVEDVDS